MKNIWCLAPCWHRFDILVHVFPRFVFRWFREWYFGCLSIEFDSDMGTWVCVFWHTLWILVQPCSARVSLKVPRLVVATLLAPLLLFGNLLGSILAPESVKHPDYRRHPPSKWFFPSSPGAELAEGTWFIRIVELLIPLVLPLVLVLSETVDQ